MVKTIKVGTEPFGCALTPDGSRLYVANQSSETVSVIDTKQDRVIETIEKGVGTKPHGIAITADGKKVYVTQLSPSGPAPRPPLTRCAERGGRRRPGRTRHCYRRADQSGDQHRDLEPAPRYRVRSDGNTLAREPHPLPCSTTSLERFPTCCDHHH